MPIRSNSITAPPPTRPPCYNGCTNDQFSGGGWGNTNNPYHSGTFFNYTSYQILPDVKASIQLNFSRLQQRASGTIDQR